MKKYDIFISYRRTAYETANLIATRLKAAGYSVFFDVETMRSGKFNEQLYDVIGQCKDFLLVLSPNALDRCKDKDDWVRLEACKAMECGKNIIPVMLNGFHWPEPMPNGMEELSNYQAIAANSVEYFDMAIKKLQEQYLHSKPKLPILRVLKAAAAGFAILVAVLLVLWGAFIIISKDTCQKYATLITQDAACVHVLAEANHNLAQRWEQFDRGLDLNREPRLSEMKEDMLSNINQAEKDIRRAWRTDSVPLSIPIPGLPALTARHQLPGTGLVATACHSVSPRLSGLPGTSEDGRQRAHRCQTTLRYSPVPVQCLRPQCLLCCLPRHFVPFSQKFAEGFR